VSGNYSTQTKKLFGGVGFVRRIVDGNEFFVT
jgi:hypothetical protein